MAPISKETLLRYCTSLYDELRKGAVTHHTDEGEEYLLWEGMITKVITNLNISNAHYSRVLDTLKELGCIEQVRRGARSVPSQFALYKPPPLVVDDIESPLTRSSPGAMLAVRVRNLERRLQGVDLSAILVDYERRLKVLETESRKANNGT